MSGAVPEEQPKVARVNNRVLMLGSVIAGLILFAGMYLLSTAGDAARTAATTKAIDAAKAPTQDWVRSAQLPQGEIASARGEYLRLRELETQQPNTEEMDAMLARLKQEEAGAGTSQAQPVDQAARAMVAPLVPAGVGAMSRPQVQEVSAREGLRSPATPSIAQLMGGMGGVPGLPVSAGAPEDDPATRHARFLEEVEVPSALQITPGPAQGPGVIPEGALIAATMLSEIVSDQPGMAQAVVSRDVYDAAGSLVIPQGTRALGSYDSRVVFGQNRLLVAWHRLVFPDGRSWELPSLPGATLRGASGVKDQVNHHFVRIFGSALLMSAISAGAQIGQPETSNGERLTSSQIAAGAVAQELSRTSAELLTQNLRIAPTIRIRSGAQFAIQVSRDLVVP